MRSLPCAQSSFRAPAKRWVRTHFVLYEQLVERPEYLILSRKYHWEEPYYVLLRYLNRCRFVHVSFCKIKIFQVLSARSTQLGRVMDPDAEQDTDSSTQCTEVSADNIAEACGTKYSGTKAGVDSCELSDSRMNCDGATGPPAEDLSAWIPGAASTLDHCADDGHIFRSSDSDGGQHQQQPSSLLEIDDSCSPNYPESEQKTELMGNIDVSTATISEQDTTNLPTNPPASVDAAMRTASFCTNEADAYIHCQPQSSAVSCEKDSQGDALTGNNSNAAAGNGEGDGAAPNDLPAQLCRLWGGAPPARAESLTVVQDIFGHRQELDEILSTLAAAKASGVGGAYSGTENSLALTATAEAIHQVYPYVSCGMSYSPTRRQVPLPRRHILHVNRCA